MIRAKHSLLYEMLIYDQWWWKFQILRYIQKLISIYCAYNDDAAFFLLNTI